jgi:Tol biopolymer transport system component
MDPTVSPDGKLLAFVSDRGSSGYLHLWVRQLGSNGSAVELTHDAADAREPGFSPDGSTIVFRSDKNGGGIYSIPSIGGESTQIAAGGRSPRFSPDGDWIAYWTGTENVTDNAAGVTYIIPARGGAPRRVGEDLPSGTYPIWAADSKHVLVFASDVLRFIGMNDWWVLSLDGTPSQRTQAFAILKRQGFDMSRNPRAYHWSGGKVTFTAALGDTVNIWWIDLSERGWRASGAPRRLTSGTTDEVSPTLTARGQLVFASLNPTFLIGSIGVGPNGLPGDKVELLTDTGAESGPSVSADGRYLAFTGRGFVIRTKDLRTGKEWTIAERAVHPQLTPDGSMVAYTTLLPDGRKEVVSLTGESPRVITAGAGFIYSWSNDKNSLLTIKLPYDGCIYSLDVRTGKSTLFLRKPGYELYQAKFSPDNQWVLVQAQQTSPKPLSRVFVVPIRAGVPKEEAEWIRIGDGDWWDDKPRWSVDGRVVYFISDRDGHRCLWAQRLNGKTRLPEGEVFSVHHFHKMRLSLLNVGLWQLEIDVAKDKIVLGLGDMTGNIWSKD